MFKVGDRVRLMGTSYDRVPEGSIGVTKDDFGYTRMYEVVFYGYHYPTSKGHHGTNPRYLELVQSAKPKGISAFIKKWEEEYAKTA